jgi:hypothetical protein
MGMRTFILWFFGISKTVFSIADHFVTDQIITMTIDLDFFSKGRSVLSVNMCAVNINNKVCEKNSNEELDGAFTRDEETEDEIFTDTSVIKKIWNDCLEHGYISHVSL